MGIPRGKVNVSIFIFLSFIFISRKKLIDLVPQKIIPSGELVPTLMSADEIRHSLNTCYTLYLLLRVEGANERIKARRLKCKAE